jgi:formylglycine-generating enzyme required for sulfatase activity
MHFGRMITQCSALMAFGAVIACAPPQTLNASGKQPSVAIEREKGDVFVDCPGCPEMVVVPAGTFLMGSPPAEPGRYHIEGPQHEVKISRPFGAGIHEVTWAQWELCVLEQGCSDSEQIGAGDDNGWGKGDLPVINVDWDDARSFAAWLSRKTGAKYRLLSEAEWEYVARANTETPFHTGPQITTADANFEGTETYNGSPKGIYRQKTTAVGKFPANAFGLFDVHGNLWEWVQDCYNSNYEGAPSDGSAWETGDCTRRVTRSGSWANTPQKVRSAMRDRDRSSIRNKYYGIRVARDLD